MQILNPIQLQLERIFSAKEKRLSVIMVLIIALITITPLCGFLFQCGCDWPWFGLDEKCNIYQTNIRNQCPWCVSMPMGIFSTFAATSSGVIVSIAGLNGIISQSLTTQVLIRTILGLIVFVCVAILMAVLAVLLQ